MTIKPLRNNVLLSPSEAQAENRIGIIIAAQVSDEAIVVACGPEVKELKLGDRIRYDTQSVRKLDRYLMCREADILCVVESDKQSEYDYKQLIAE